METKAVLEMVVTDGSSEAIDRIVYIIKTTP